MVFIPLAVAGYMAYMKRKAEREAKEMEAAEQLGEQDGDVSDENEQTGSAITQLASDGGDAYSEHSGPSDQDVKPVGPMKKFLIFCENVEKEVQKAQERRRRKVVEDAFANPPSPVLGDATVSSVLKVDDNDATQDEPSRGTAECVHEGLLEEKLGEDIKARVKSHTIGDTKEASLPERSSIESDGQVADDKADGEEGNSKASVICEPPQAVSGDEESTAETEVQNAVEPSCINPSAGVQEDSSFEENKKINFSPEQPSVTMEAFEAPQHLVSRQEDCSPDRLKITSE